MADSREFEILKTTLFTENSEKIFLLDMRIDSNIISQQLFSNQMTSD